MTVRQFVGGELRGIVWMEEGGISIIEAIPKKTKEFKI